MGTIECNINNEQLKKYLKENLKLKLTYGIGFSKKIQLVLDKEVISEIDLSIF